MTVHGFPSDLLLFSAPSFPPLQLDCRPHHPRRRRRTQFNAAVGGHRDVRLNTSRGGRDHDSHVIHLEKMKHSNIINAHYNKVRLRLLLPSQTGS